MTTRADLGDDLDGDTLADPFGPPVPNTPDGALAVDYVPLAELRTYHRNPRRGDTTKIAESLRVNGQYKPIVANRGTHTGRPKEVLAGNHTLTAMRDLAVSGDPRWDRIAVVWRDVDDDQAARIVAADNRTSDVGDYDERLLAELLADLPDLDGTGYDPGDLADLEAALADDDSTPLPAETDPDEVPDPPPDPVCAPGDVWVLGPHRLVVGDATDTGSWDAVLGGGKADAVWTDPPYGVSYVGKTKDALQIQNDGEEGNEGLLRAVFALAVVSTREGAVWYVAAPPGPVFLGFATVLSELDVWRQTLVWVKDQFVMGHSDYHYRHEAVFYGWTPGAAHHAPPDRKQTTVHEVARPRRSTDHPTMKPVELIQMHLANSTDPGDVVVDPFAGSGSTVIACHQLRRVARVIELDPRYADVICRRYQEHTGTWPECEGVAVDFTRPRGDGQDAGDDDV